MNTSSSTGGETSWRSSFSDAERAAVIEKLTRILLSISSSSEQNTERIQQIALRFESQVYTAASHKTEYYQIISNKISSIAEKKRIIFAASANAAGSSSGTSTANSASIQSFNESGSGSLPGSPPAGSTFAKNFASPNVPNPQMLLMNTLGKGINQQQQQQTKDSMYSSLAVSSAENAGKKNPFIPGFPLTSKSQVQIPNGKPSSNLFYQSTALSSTTNSSFHAVNAPIPIPSAILPPAPVQIQAPQPKMHYHSTSTSTSTSTIHSQPPPQQPPHNEKLYAGSLPNLTLNSEEKNAVKKIIDSLKAFIPKIEILITVSNSIGIPMENLKKISNLKDILVKQLELFKSDVYLLSPFMAENLAEHMRKFVTLLLHKVNSHPAAQSIIEKIRKASEANSASSSSSGNSTGANSASSILPSPLNASGEGGSAFASSSNSAFKKGTSPASAGGGIIRESPFKATTAYNSTANSNSSNTKRQQTRSNSTTCNTKPQFVNSKVNKIPTLGYLKAKCKRKASVPIEYLRSQLQFIQEASNAEIGHIELEPAVKRLREIICSGTSKST